MPTLQSSPLTMASILPERSSITCCAFVGEGLPEILALGAAMGQPAASIKSLAVCVSGSLIPTVSSPPVVASGIPGFFFTTMVSGPGQKFSIKATISSLNLGVS